MQKWPSCLVSQLQLATLIVKATTNTFWYRAAASVDTYIHEANVYSIELSKVAQKIRNIDEYFPTKL